jgi:hypothetical protein
MADEAVVHSHRRGALMRLYDWQLRFAEFVATRASMPFAWGQNDCCLFAADAVLAMTGKDHASELRGYDSAIAAQRLIDECGGLREIVRAALGDSILPAFASVGDVVLVENEGREMLAICNGTTALAPGETGIAVLGMNTALAAWRA